jgi:hypothetical protein
MELVTSASPNLTTVLRLIAQVVPAHIVVTDSLWMVAHVTLVSHSLQIAQRVFVPLLSALAVFLVSLSQKDTVLLDALLNQLIVTLLIALACVKPVRKDFSLIWRAVVQPA